MNTPTSKQQKLSQVTLNNLTNQAKIIDRLISDLEELCKKLLNQFQTDNQTITNDSYELQKFCSKLEYLLQYKLKEKKSLLSSNNNNTIKDYWVVIIGLLNNSRAFEDAIKYVKNLNETKTNIGRARAFIRFCLQYHRLADAIQQMTLDDKQLSNWYIEQSIWFNPYYKSKIIQILYDLTDVNFDIISKLNYELDTSWPTIMASSSNTSSNTTPLTNTNSRTRTFSYSSYSSTNNEIIDSLLSSTPLEMDYDVFNKLLINKNDDKISTNMLQLDDDLQSNISISSKKVSPTGFVANNASSVVTVAEEEYIENEMSNKHLFLLDLYDKQLKEQQNKLDDLEKNYNHILNENKQLNEVKFENQMLNEKINELNRQLNELKIENDNNKQHVIENKNESIYDNDQYNELNEYKLKLNNLQMDFKCLNDESNQIKCDNDVLIKEINALKFELSAKTLSEENLIREAVTQTYSLNALKDMCLQQEITIDRLSESLDIIKNKRQAEMDIQLNEIQVLKNALEIKTNENEILNDQLIRLTKSLEEERKANKNIQNELNEIRKTYNTESEEKKILLNQLEMDNNEIKKRLVKLIKEKAELWQKADNLEYENLLKSSAMWHDDSTVHNCMNCNSTFSLLLRKHHCRICLKIFCYYCCNNWIEYNNSKVRVCKKCQENQEVLLKQQEQEHLLPAKSNIENNSPNTVKKLENALNAAINSEYRAASAVVTTVEDDDEDDDDPDINFEVRPEKLPCNDNISDGSSVKSISKNASAIDSTNLEKQDDKRVKEAEFYTPEHAIDDLDTFAIVSDEEIDSVLHEKK